MTPESRNSVKNRQPLLDNGSVNVSLASDTNTIIQELLEVVFSMRSMPRLCKESPERNLVNSLPLHNMLRTVIAVEQLMTEFSSAVSEEEKKWSLQKCLKSHEAK
jgi:predicted hydrolase (HD superfamily)